MAEIRATEIGIEVRHGQDYPIGVLGFVGAVVGYECMNNLVWNILGYQRGNRFNFLWREGYFILPKCAKLQRVGKNIVKAQGLMLQTSFCGSFSPMLLETRICI